MKLIDHATATEDLEFTEGNPGTGTPATRVTAQWLNVLQAEIAAVVEEAGITLDQTGVDRTQLLEALETLFAGTDFASNSEAFTGTETAKALTPSNFGVKDHSSSGYQRFPGGLILQWGTASVSVPGNGTGGEATVSYPLTFPTAAIRGMVCRRQTTWESSWGGPYIDTMTTTQITVGVDEAATTAGENKTVDWLVWGY